MGHRIIHILLSMSFQNDYTLNNKNKSGKLAALTKTKHQQRKQGSVAVNF